MNTRDEDTGCNFAENLARHARERPTQMALAMGRQGRLSQRVSWEQVDYATMNARTNAVAAMLRGRGLRQGDRALFLMRPSIDLFAALFAVVRLGAIPVLIDPRAGLRHVLACIERSRPRFAIVPAGELLRRLAPRVLRSVQVFVSPREIGRVKPGAVVAPAACRSDDDALIAFTSGSTGPAKAVAITHRMLAAQTNAFAAGYGWKAGDTMVLCLAPVVLHAFGGGLRTVIPAMDLANPGSARIENVVDAANAYEADIIFASPVVWMNVVREAERIPVRFESTRQILTAGAPVDAALQRRLLRIAPEGARMLIPYGATEALPITTIDSDEVLADTAQRSRDGSGACVGRPFEGVEVHIIGLTDEPVPQWRDDLTLAPGELGEIVVGGATVSAEYKDLPEANAYSKIRRGTRILHRTGDVGYWDERGRLWFGGRKSELLHTREGLVAPVMVENVFHHPMVLRTALVGVGQRPRQEGVLCVEMDRGRRLTLEIAAELHAQLADTRHNHAVSAVVEHPRLPVDARHNSKIRRGELQGWAAERRNGPNVIPWGMA